MLAVDFFMNRSARFRSPAAPTPILAGMTAIVTALLPVVVIVMPRFKRPVDAAMLPSVEPELMGAVMTVFDSVVSCRVYLLVARAVGHGDRASDFHVPLRAQLRPAPSLN